MRVWIPTLTMTSPNGFVYVGFNTHLGPRVVLRKGETYVVEIPLGEYWGPVFRTYGRRMMVLIFGP